MTSKLYFISMCHVMLYNMMGKDKKENSNFDWFATSSSQRSRVSRNVYYTMTIP